MPSTWAGINSPVDWRTAAFLFGDHLSFTANFQPNLILPVMLGKLGGGIFAFFLAYWLSVPRALELEREEASEEKPEELAGPGRPV